MSTRTRRRIREKGTNHAKVEDECSGSGVSLALGATAGTTACGGSNESEPQAESSATTTAAAEGAFEELAVDGAPTAVAAGEDAVWVVLDQGDRVARLDPQSGEIVGEPIPVGDGAVGVVAEKTMSGS